MHVDPPALDQPAVLELSHKDLIALDKRKGTILLHLLSVSWRGM